MTIRSQQTKALFASIVGIAVGGFGCSGSESGGGNGGAPGSGGSSALTGGKASTGGQTAAGGQVGNGGSAQSGGATGSGGTVSSGGSGSGGKAEGGSPSSGGKSSGGASSGGTSSGGTNSAKGGSGTAGSGTGGGSAGGSTASGGMTGAGGSTSSGTCTASKATGRNVTGTGPHKVVVETNTEAGIKCGTIYRPADMGTEKYPIFVWGEGGCSQDGYSNAAAMGEIASWGYFIVADGTPGGTGACAGGQDGKQFLGYITWAIAENSKSCSAYYNGLDTTKIAADGFSCGGLMAENVSGDPRFTAIGITSSGLMGGGSSVYQKWHTPFKVMNGGGPSGGNDVAYPNGLADYNEISKSHPAIYFSKTAAGHGGDLGQARGDFNSVNLAWLNWQLKGDTGATGKGFLYGSTCKFCTASGWDYKSANIQ